MKVYKVSPLLYNQSCRCDHRNPYGSRFKYCIAGPYDFVIYRRCNKLKLYTYFFFWLLTGSRILIDAG